MKPNIHAGTGAGRYRQTWRIKEYLASIDLSMAAVAREIEKSSTLVRETVKGTRNNRSVLRHLLKLGCPAEYLSLPKDMRV